MLRDAGGAGVDIPARLVLRRGHGSHSLVWFLHECCQVRPTLAAARRALQEVRLAYTHPHLDPLMIISSAILLFLDVKYLE